MRQRLYEESAHLANVSTGADFSFFFCCSTLLFEPEIFSEKTIMCPGSQLKCLSKAVMIRRQELSMFPAEQTVFTHLGEPLVPRASRQRIHSHLWRMRRSPVSSFSVNPTLLLERRLNQQWHLGLGISSRLLFCSVCRDEEGKYNDISSGRVSRVAVHVGLWPCRPRKKD